MPDPAALLLFVTASLALLAVPGPAVLYIVARSLHQGRRAGLASVLGILLGGAAHVLAATVGLSALLVSSAVAFTAVKYAGAAYLLYLGVRTLLARDPVTTVEAPPAQPLTRVFWQGALVNLLNPKTAMFFLAFLPQFVDPARGPAAPQFLLLGLIFLGLAVISDSAYVLLAGAVAGRLRGNRVFLRRQRQVSGGTYLTLGVITALTRQG